MATGVIADLRFFTTKVQSSNVHAPAMIAPRIVFEPAKVEAPWRHSEGALWDRGMRSGSR
jgi:hypothetical protein